MRSFTQRISDSLACALMLVACVFLPEAIAEEGGENFLSVKQWKGVITLRISDSLSSSRSWEAGSENRRLQSTRTYRYQVHTGDGMKVMVDPFIKEEDVRRSDEKPEKGDMMHGRDMNQMEQAMKRSGMDPAMMGMVMQQMNKMQGMHISANKYKQWTEASFDLNVTGSLDFGDHINGQAMDTSGETCSYKRSLTRKGTYEGVGGLMLAVNLQKQAYSFKWSSTEKGRQIATQVIDNRDSCEGNEHSTRQVSFSGPASNSEGMLVEFEPLPASPVLSGSKAIHETMKDGSNRDVVLQWTFVAADKELPEALLEYDTGGEEWLPEDDNSVSASLEWGENVAPSQVRFTLYDISEEPGIYLNSKDTNTEPDLEFAEDNAANGFEIRKSGKSYVALKEGVSGVSEGIVLHAKDFGAYGKLKAEIKVDGHWFEATSKQLGLSYLPVPFDKNNNLIADKWEKDVGVYTSSLPPTWDEDPFPAHQKSHGDGFTLYEEYRGFREAGHVFKKGDHEQVKDGHVRMDPMYKDVFVVDADGLFKKYYKPYNPANLNWHFIDRSMMKGIGNLWENPDFRWVNFNTSKKHFFRNQYAVFIINKGKATGSGLENDVGYTPMLSSCTKPMRYSRPLKCIYSAEIYLDTINAWADKAPGTSEDKDRYALGQVTTTVIHEMGHAIGISHHRPNETEGAKSCAMRYDSSTEMGHPRLFGFLRTRYCTKEDVYITGEADEDTGEFKRFSGHNCYGQINIKGD